MKRFFLILICLGSIGFGYAEQSTLSWDRASVLLEEYCLTCHDSDTAKGDVILDGIYDSEGKVTDYKLWERALHSVTTGEMPPKDKKTQPKPDERNKLGQWIKQALDRSARENAGDPGVVTMRRLTNAEYRHTLRELTGKWKNFSEGFVADGGGGEGFSNTGDVLFISPEQLEKYLRSAREVASLAEILPGSGITFQNEPVGDRGPELVKNSVEQGLRSWYRQQAELFLPKDGDDLREADYLLACWKWKHREITGAVSLEALAKEAKLDTDFLNNWWFLLNEPQEQSRYLALTIDAFHGAPHPNPAQPKSVPENVENHFNWMQNERRQWYVKKDEWASVQRMQQDADSVKPARQEIPLGNQQQVQLLVSDVGDGNAGDIVHWSDLSFRWPDGNWQSLAGWMWKLRNDHGTEKTKWLQPHLDRWRSHPAGKEMPKETFAVQAPSIITLPVPESATAFTATALLEPDAPNREQASVQWLVKAGNETVKLPAVIPGVLTMWHRLSPAHKKLMGEFDVMKRVLPANHNKRCDMVEWNLYKWDDKPVGPYYLSNEQLFRRAPNDREGIEAKRRDLSFVSRKNVPDEVLGHWDEAVLDHLRKFADRAWRRPVSHLEYENLKKIYFDARSKEMNQESAAREALVSILVSPHFLFRVEKGAGEKESLLSQYEYAARLSYFLWSGPPDEALLQSARDGTLLSDNWEVAANHVDRMVRNYRSFALAQEFGGQWLGFHDLYTLKNIDPEKFPEFDWKLRHLMYEEVWRFMAKVIQESQPVTQLLQADFTLLNEPLARHYGIPDVGGEEFRAVEVAKYQRGGIFGMGAFHAKTSYPVRTSPVLRGDWILREVLGRPTPPPPPNVPELKEEGEAGQVFTLRQQLEKHRENASCAGCHDKIDPLGFALEKYDPIGRWREADEHGKPIDNRGETSDGMALEGINGLRQWFEKEEDQFLHHFCTKLAGYALGREIGASDQLLLQSMVDNMKKWNYTFDAAIKPLVLSRQFQYRKNP